METAVVGGGELGSPVQVKACGKAMVFEELHADAKSPVQVLCGLEQPVQRVAGGIIGTEDKARAF